MVLLIDANVILDFLLEREGFFEDACDVMERCAAGHAKGYVAFHSISNIWYVLRGVDENVKRGYLKRLCRILEVCGATHAAVERALDKADFKDLEDCLQDQCALAVHSDYIVTKNTGDFVHAETRTITPADLKRFYPR